jgi:hypothetical protein
MPTPFGLSGFGSCGAGTFPPIRLGAVKRTRPPARPSWIPAGGPALAASRFDAPPLLSRRGSPSLQGSSGGGAYVALANERISDSGRQ